MLTTTRWIRSRCTQDARRRNARILTRWTPQTAYFTREKKHKTKLKQRQKWEAHGNDRGRGVPQLTTISFSNSLQIMAPTTVSPAPTRSFSRNPIRAFYQ